MHIGVPDIYLASSDSPLNGTKIHSESTPEWQM